MIPETPCYFCGLAGADTDEHIPPKSFFPDGQRQGIIKVPAHRNCNQRWEDSIEYMRYVLTGVGSENFTAKVLFDTKAKRSIRRNPRLWRKLYEGLKRNIPIVSAGGIILGKTQGISFDRQLLDKFLDHMIKGLYYHHQRTPLGSKAIVKGTIQPQKYIEAPKEFQTLPTVIIHPKVFRYRFMFSDDNPVASIWLLGFYDLTNGTIAAFTDPVDPTVEVKIV